MNDIIERTDEIEREASDRLLASNGSLDDIANAYPRPTYFNPFYGASAICEARMQYLRDHPIGANTLPPAILYGLGINE